jgi:hypothetical protein
MPSPRPPKADTRWKRNVATVHLNTIAKRNGIKIRWVKGRNWMEDSGAYEVAKMVYMPRPYTAKQYLVALHELGHLLGTLKSSGRHELNVDSTPGAYIYLAEASAWAWAIEHTHPELEEAIMRGDYAATVGAGMTSHAWELAWNAEGRD